MNKELRKQIATEISVAGITLENTAAILKKHGATYVITTSYEISARGVVYRKSDGKELSKPPMIRVVAELKQAITEDMK